MTPAGSSGAAAVLPPNAGLTCAGDARNQIGRKSYGRPGRYRRAGRDRLEPDVTRAATTMMIANGMTTKTRIVLNIDNLDAPRPHKEPGQFTVFPVIRTSITVAECGTSRSVGCQHS